MLAGVEEVSKASSRKDLDWQTSPKARSEDQTLSGGVANRTAPFVTTRDWDDDMSLFGAICRRRLAPKATRN